MVEKSLDVLGGQEGSVSLGVDSLTGQETLPLGNDQSNTNRAVFSALASGGDVTTKFNFFRDSLNVGSDDTPIKESLKDVEGVRQSNINNVVANVLVDNTVPDNVKQAVPYYLSKERSPDPRKIVAEQTAFEDNGSEGDNQEEARSWVFGDIDAALKYKKDSAKYVQALAASVDDTAFGAYKDILAEFIPGMRPMNLAAIREIVDTKEGKGPKDLLENFADIFTSFSNEKEMRDMIDSKPPEQRMEMLKKIMGVVQDQYGPGLFDSNEYAIIERARSLIGDPEATFMSDSKGAALASDLILDGLSIIGISPRSAKVVTKAVATDAVESVAPKVVFKETEAAVEQAATVAVKEPSAPTYLDVGGKHMTEQEIAQRRMELQGLAESKFDKETVMTLRSKQAELGSKIAALEEEKLANKANASALAKEQKTSRGNAVRKANSALDESIAEYKAQQKGITNQLNYSKRGYQAEAELSRFEQAVAKAKPVAPAAVKDNMAVRNAVQQALREARVESVSGMVHPASLLSTVAEVNPSKAASMIKMAVADESGELAQIIGGKSADDILISATMPSPAVSATVKVKPVLDVDERTLDYVLSNINAGLTAKELSTAKKELQWKVLGSVGVKLRTPMSQIVSDEENGFRLKALFTDGSTGFNSAQDALDRTAFALRDIGVDSNSLVLMKRQPEGYVPLDMKKTDVASLPRGDYAVQVDHHWNYTLSKGFEDFGVKYNWLDWAKGPFNGMVSSRQGSLTRHMFPPATLFNKDIYLAAVPAFDVAAGVTKKLAKLADEFNVPYGKLSTKEKVELADYIKAANTGRIPFHAPQMIANGFTHAQVNVMSNWKRYWDTAYVLENADKVRTLQLTGYHLFEHQASGTSLVAKPLARNAQIKGKVWDADTDMILDLSQAGKKDVYDKGGYIAILRDHITDQSGEVAKYVVVRNRVGNYTRAFNSNDKVLNYIDGYYAVRHEAPLFVVQNVKDKSGRILYKRAVAEAGDLREAELMARGIASRTAGHTFARDGHDSADFFIREDLKTKEAMGLNEARFDVGISSGRSSQRFRGEVLESYDPMAGGQSQYIQNPLEAMQQTAFSLGGRLAARSTIENLKARWMSHYSDLVAADPEMHIKGFPTDPAQIGKGLVNSWHQTDARTVWEWINQLEGGYNSLADSAIRSIAGSIADGLTLFPDVKAVKGAENTLRKFSGSGSLTSTMKAAVYWTGQALGGPATFLTQASQGLANLSLSFYKPQLYSDLGAMLGARMKATTGDFRKRGDALWKEWESSGLTAAVDVHGAAFLGGAGSSAELGGAKAGKGAKAFHKTMKVAQGFFNRGEEFNLYTAWLAKRMDYIDATGKVPSTKEEMKRVAAEARVLALDMNRAGQMPYNENTLNVSLQYLQVLHKAIVLPLTSRSLSMKDRARILAAPTFLFGLPAGSVAWLSDKVDSLPTDDKTKGEMKDALTWSLAAKTFGYITPELANLDYSKYNPVDAAGMAERLSTLFTYPEMFTKTPAGYLTERSLTFLKTAAAYVGITENETGIEPNNTAMWNSLAKLTAGTSAALRGRVLMENGVLVDKYGRAQPVDVSPVEGYMATFGLSPKQVGQMYDFTGKSIEINEEFQDDLSTLIKNAREQLALNGVLSDNPDYAIKLIGAVTKVFKDNPRAMDELMKQLRNDVRMNGESSYLVAVMKASGWADEAKVRELANRIPDKEQRDQFFKIYNQLQHSE